MRDVEYADAFAHSLVFGEDSRILDRHLPPTEVDKTRSELGVNVMER